MPTRDTAASYLPPVKETPTYVLEQILRALKLHIADQSLRAWQIMAAGEVKARKAERYAPTVKGTARSAIEVPMEYPHER